MIRGKQSRVKACLLTCIVICTFVYFLMIALYIMSAISNLFCQIEKFYRFLKHIEPLKIAGLFNVLFSFILWKNKWCLFYILCYPLLLPETEIYCPFISIYESTLFTFWYPTFFFHYVRDGFFYKFIFLLILKFWKQNAPK